ncbi:hypothetical protein G6F65_017638 [Rhizopus arrhizus]|nr:hypothetical protein G6F65_017638 [Rhizopus arrhizus]
MAGVPPLYRLERLSGRYSDTAREASATRSVHALDDWPAPDLGSLKKSFPNWFPFVDVQFGSGAYMPLFDGAKYQVFMDPRGALFVRPDGEATAEGLKRRGCANIESMSLPLRFPETPAMKQPSTSLAASGNALALAIANPGALGTIDAYISSVNRLPVLSAERETELGRRLRDQEDLGAARELILSHLRLVVSVARQQHRPDEGREAFRPRARRAPGVGRRAL